jgi:hypothetical protein
LPVGFASRPSKKIIIQPRAREEIPARRQKALNGISPRRILAIEDHTAARRALPPVEETARPLPEWVESVGGAVRWLSSRSPPNLYLSGENM